MRIKPAKLVRLSFPQPRRGNGWTVGSVPVLQPPVLLATRDCPRSVLPPCGRSRDPLAHVKQRTKMSWLEATVVYAHKPVDRISPTSRQGSRSNRHRVPTRSAHRTKKQDVRTLLCGQSVRRHKVAGVAAATRLALRQTDPLTSVDHPPGYACAPMSPPRLTSRRTHRTAPQVTSRHVTSRHGTARHGTARHGTARHGTHGNYLYAHKPG